MAAFTLQDAFGGPPEEEQTALPTTDFAQQGQLVDEMRALKNETQTPSADQVAALREQQEASLGEHQRFAQSRNEMQGQLQERSSDLESVQGFLDATNPNVSKPARRFQLTGWMKQNGIDPRSESAKELLQLAVSLPPEELTALRGSIVEQSQTAPPGSMRKLFTAVGNGQVPASSLFQNVADYSARAAQTAQNEAAELQAPPQMAGSPRPQNYQVGPQAEELDPGWSTVIPGMTPGTRYRRQDAQTEFGVAIPRGEEERKALMEFRTRQSDLLKLQSQIGNLHDMVQGNPDALGPSGTVSQWADSIASQIQNFDKGRLQRHMTVEADKWVRHLAPGDPEKAAVIRSRFAELSFSMARTMSGPGVLSQADVEAAATTLGNSWSAGQTTAVLRDVGARGLAAYNDWTRGQVGKEVGLPVDNMSVRQLRGLARSEATPADLRQSARTELERQLAVAEAEAASAEGGFRVQAGKRGDRRSSPTPEAEEEGFRRQADTERRQGQEDRSRRIRREGESDVRAEIATELNLAEFKRRAQWRDEDKTEAQKQRLQAAFQQFAKALGGSASRMSVPSGGSGGGGQDAGAFKLPAKPQRQAPRIPQLPLSGAGGIKVGK